MALSNEYMLKSQPCKVFFAGFESTTTWLQQAGWQLAARQDYHREEINITMHLPAARLYMVATPTRYGFFQQHEKMRFGPDGIDGRCPEFHVTQVSSEMRCMVREQWDAFRPVDAMPQMVQMTGKSVEEYGFFAAPLVRTEEIVIEPSSVSECLDLIRRLQSPNLAEIRERNRRRDAREALPQQAFHAQILSLAA